jgi:hypothetical protein
VHRYGVTVLLEAEERSRFCPPFFAKPIDSTNVVPSSSLIGHHTSSMPRTILKDKLPLWCSFIVALMYMIALSFGYFLMLAAMTYDTGVFLATILGLGIGFFLFKDTEKEEMSGNIDPCCST